MSKKCNDTGEGLHWQSGNSNPNMKNSFGMVGYDAETPLYIVMGRRWGDEESHSYIYGWDVDKNVAIAMADELRDNRGGKYAGVVYKVYGGLKPFSHREEVYRRESQAA